MKKQDNGENLTEILNVISEESNEIFESVLNEDSQEVATTIAGYIAKKLIKRSKCETCKVMLSCAKSDLNNNHYLNFLSRGGLTVPSSILADFTCSCFAILHYTEQYVQRHSLVNVTEAFEMILKEYRPCRK